MNFIIHRLEKHDISFLRDMVYESAFVPNGQPKFPRTILDEPSVSKIFEGFGERSGDIGLIVEKGEVPIGAIWLRLFVGSTPEMGMAIIKEFRGLGIGRQLHSKLEKEANKYGYKKISLSVDPLNPARYLYERLGYEHVGWDDAYWKMEKDLV